MSATLFSGAAWDLVVIGLLLLFAIGVVLGMALGKAATLGDRAIGVGLDGHRRTDCTAIADVDFDWPDRQDHAA